MKIIMPDEYYIRIDGNMMHYKEYFIKNDEMKLMVDRTVTILKQMFADLQNRRLIVDYDINVLSEENKICIDIKMVCYNKSFIYDYLIAEFLPNSNIGNIKFKDILFTLPLFSAVERYLNKGGDRE